MRLYHVTTPDSAVFIIANGFRDGAGWWRAGETWHRWCGVWLTDDPVTVRGQFLYNLGGEVLPWRVPAVYLCVELDLGEEVLAAHEWFWECIGDNRDAPPEAPEVGANYREWLLRANWLGQHAVKVTTVANDESLRRDLACERKTRPGRPASTVPPAVAGGPGTSCPAGSKISLLVRRRPTGRLGEALFGPGPGR